ncbi:amidohydrolase family protein [Kribbella sp. NPDC051620]|uniref:amidohydrolase family protein n=1 Tax=Kribbella sp. NPDC051620 TaxID=3364120 RepID=UPI00378BB76A
MARTVIRGARVFDGQGLTEPREVVIDGGVISAEAGELTGAEVIEAAGSVLLPGLIDAHLHLHGPETLDKLLSFGVTTGLDMACWPASRLRSLRDLPGVTDIRSAGLPVIGTGGRHAKFLGASADAYAGTPEQAVDAVQRRVADGSDYLKLVLEAPGEGGPDQATAAALVVAAHDAGLLTVAHAATVGAYDVAIAIGVDVVTHVPFREQLRPDQVEALAAAGRVVVPTLTMAEAVNKLRGSAELFKAALESVAALHEAGVPLLAGTDANAQPGVPPVEHGSSLHRELELLAQAGLSNAEALYAATAGPAKYFKLADRGVVEPGRRADLLLIAGDPLTDLSATRDITRVWVAG